MLLCHCMPHVVYSTLQGVQCVAQTCCVLSGSLAGGSRRSLCLPWFSEHLGQWTLGLAEGETIVMRSSFNSQTIVLGGTQRPLLIVSSCHQEHVWSYHANLRHPAMHVQMS